MCGQSTLLASQARAWARVFVHLQPELRLSPWAPVLGQSVSYQDFPLLAWCVSYLKLVSGFVFNVVLPGGEGKCKLWVLRPPTHSSGSYLPQEHIFWGPTLKYTILTWSSHLMVQPEFLQPSLMLCSSHWIPGKVSSSLWIPQKVSSSLWIPGKDSLFPLNSWVSFPLPFEFLGKFSSSLWIIGKLFGNTKDNFCSLCFKAFSQKLNSCGPFCPQLLIVHFSTLPCVCWHPTRKKVRFFFSLKQIG